MRIGERRLVGGELLMATFNSKRYAFRHERRDAANAFFPDPGEGPALAPDDLAEGLAEDFMVSATTGQEQGAEAHERFVEEEIGGPFVTTLPRVEFARGYDESNTPEAEREALPTTGPWRRDSTPDDDIE